MDKKSTSKISKKKSEKKRIKGSKHGFSFANQGKLDIWTDFLNEYQKNYISMNEFVWIEGFEYSVNRKVDSVIVKESKICCPSQGLLDVPKYFDYKLFEQWLERKGMKTRLSARALSSLTGQVCGAIQSVCKKQSQRIYRLGVLRNDLEKLELKRGSIEKIEELKKNIGWVERKIRNTKLTKPSVKEIEKLGAELSSKCAVLLDPRDPEVIASLNKRNKKEGHKLIDPNNPQDLDNYKPKFNYVLKLSSLGEDFGTIYIPIFHHKHSRKLQSQSDKILGSFLVYKNEIDIRWELTDVPKKEKGQVVGGDTGLKTILTLSDGQTAGISADWSSGNKNKTKKSANKNISDSKNELQKHSKNEYGKKKEQRRKSLDEITDILARKKPGSKGFKRAQIERDNEIRRSINELDLSEIKEIRVEKVKIIFYKKKRNKKMSRWVNSEIEKALENKCENEGVIQTYTSSPYASQRCSQCGYVHKSNRQAKIFRCRHCSFTSDADLNSAKNHERPLKTLPDGLRHWKLNRFGFFWNHDSVSLPLPPKILTEVRKLGLKNNGEELESLLHQKDVLSRIVSLLEAHSALQKKSHKNKKMNTFLSKL